MQGCFILAAFLSLILGSTSIQAQPSSAPAASPPSSLSAKSSSDSNVGERLTGLEQEVEKLKKSQKDIWDKLGAISGLISGSVVVLVGLLVTSVLKKRELAVSRVQTVHSFMPMLQSGDRKEVEAALLAIFALDTKSRLATDLASIYQNDGSISALTKIAAGPDAGSARRAQQALANMIIISLKEILPGADDLRLSASSLRTFYDLTNQVFWALKGAVEAFTYEKSWILRDKETGKTIPKQRTADNRLVKIDLRSLKDAGVEPGMNLEAIQWELAPDDPERQSVK